MNEFASAVRIFHSRVAKENGSNRTRGYTVREIVDPLPGVDVKPRIHRRLICR